MSSAAKRSTNKNRAGDKEEKVVKKNFDNGDKYRGQLNNEG